MLFNLLLLVILTVNTDQDFFPLFMNLVNDNNLQLTDLQKLQKLSDVFTYSNVDANSFTWIDHVVCSSAVDRLVDSCIVSYEYVTSVHKPLITSFTDLLSTSLTYHQPTSLPNAIPDWSCADDLSIRRYQIVLCEKLSKLCIPKRCF